MMGNYSWIVMTVNNKDDDKIIWIILKYLIYDKIRIYYMQPLKMIFFLNHRVN